MFSLILLNILKFYNVKQQNIHDRATFFLKIKLSSFRSLEYEAQFFSHCAVIGCYYGRPGGAFTIQNTIFEMRDSRFEIQYLD